MIELLLLAAIYVVGAYSIIDCGASTDVALSRRATIYGYCYLLTTDVTCEVVEYSD